MAPRQLVSTDAHNGEHRLDEQEMESNPEKSTVEEKNVFGIKSVDPLTGEESSVWDHSDADDHDDVESLMSTSTKASSVVVDVDL